MPTNLDDKSSETTSTPPSELAEEMAFYREHLPEFLAEHEGEFVLIKGREVLGFYPERRLAQRDGYERLGLVPLLVKQIVQFERVIRLNKVVFPCYTEVSESSKRGKEATMPTNLDDKSSETAPVRNLPFQLAEETAFYREHLPEFLAEHEGEFVLIKGREVLGFFPDDSLAIRAGYQKLGIVPLLVKQIVEFEPVVHLSNYVL